MFRFNYEFENQIIDKWNKKVRLLRIVGGIIRVLMIILAILAIIFPIESLSLVGKFIGLVFLILAIYRFIDYLATPSFVRYTGNLVIVVCNLLIGLLFLSSPLELTVSTITCVLAIVLLIYGINKLTFSYRLSLFGIVDVSWVRAIGIISIIMAVILLIAPMVMTVIINYILAGFLLAGGVGLLIEVLEMNDLRL